MADWMRLSLEPAPAKAGRDFLAARCPHLHGMPVLADAQLLATELIANAVRHGAPPIELAVECADEQTILVRVADSAATIPCRRSPAPEEEGGRGLNLVHALSDAWGVDEDRPGKSVWFRLTR